MSPSVGDDNDSSAPSMPPDVNSAKLEDIPEPPMHYFGLLGHLPSIDSSFPLRTFWNMMDLYGPIFKMTLGGPRVVVGNQELANEVFDQDRFKKVSIAGGTLSVSSSTRMKQLLSLNLSFSKCYMSKVIVNLYQQRVFEDRPQLAPHHLASGVH